MTAVTNSSTELERLYRAHHGALTGFARSRVGSSHADDIASEVWRRAGVRLRRDPDAELSLGWLLTIARNLVIDTWRADRRWRRRLPMLVAGLDETVNDSSETADLVREALDRLTPLQRRVLLLHYVEGYSVPSMVPMLERSEDAVESLVRRSRARLRAECATTV